MFASVLGENIRKISASDCDTSAPFNVLTYFLTSNSSSLSKQYFDIRPNGEIFVRKSLTGDGSSTQRYTVSWRSMVS